MIIKTLQYIFQLVFQEWNPSLNFDIAALLQKMESGNSAGISNNLKKFANIKFKRNEGSDSNLYTSLDSQYSKFQNLTKVGTVD